MTSRSDNGGGGQQSGSDGKRPTESWVSARVRGLGSQEAQRPVLFTHSWDEEPALAARPGHRAARGRLWLKDWGCPCVQEPADPPFSLCRCLAPSGIGPSGLGTGAAPHPGLHL